MELDPTAVNEACWCSMAEPHYAEAIFPGRHVFGAQIDTPGWEDWVRDIYRELEED